MPEGRILSEEGAHAPEIALETPPAAPISGQDWLSAAKANRLRPGAC